MAVINKAASFVARIWLEEGPNGNPRWRGHVKHVQSDRAGFFEDLQALRLFVEDTSGIAGPAFQLDARRPRSLAAEARRAGKRPRREGNAKRGD